MDWHSIQRGVKNTTNRSCQRHGYKLCRDRSVDSNEEICLLTSC